MPWLLGEPLLKWVYNRRDVAQVMSLLQEWTDMAEARRNVVKLYGWAYFQMPVWCPALHHWHPDWHRRQVAAATLHQCKINEMRGVMMASVVKALDAHKRCLPFDGVWSSEKDGKDSHIRETNPQETHHNAKKRG